MRFSKNIENTPIDRQPEMAIFLENFCQDAVDVTIQPGWANLVLDLHIALTKLCPDYRVGQIKEKFGSLRYYIFYVSRPEKVIATAIKLLIAGYEDLSSRTCETCGAPGELRDTRWQRTLCDKHYVELPQENLL